MIRTILRGHFYNFSSAEVPNSIVLSCILPKEGFWQGHRDICDQYDIALIFDEVITGFRIDIGGAQRYFGVTPDLSIFAKALTSGYSFSVIAGKKNWMSVIEEGTPGKYASCYSRFPYLQSINQYITIDRETAAGIIP